MTSPVFLPSHNFSTTMRHLWTAPFRKSKNPKDMVLVLNLDPISSDKTSDENSAETSGEITETSDETSEISAEMFDETAEIPAETAETDFETPKETVEELLEEEEEEIFTTIVKVHKRKKRTVKIAAQRKFDDFFEYQDESEYSYENFGEYHDHDFQEYPKKKKKRHKRPKIDPYKAPNPPKNHHYHHNEHIESHDLDLHYNNRQGQNFKKYPKKKKKRQKHDPYKAPNPPKNHHFHDEYVELFNEKSSDFHSTIYRDVRFQARRPTIRNPRDSRFFKGNQPAGVLGVNKRLIRFVQRNVNPLAFAIQGSSEHEAEFFHQ